MSCRPLRRGGLPGTTRPPIERHLAGGVFFGSSRLAGDHVLVFGTTGRAFRRSCPEIEAAL
jgi:hypothetical protein